MAGAPTSWKRVISGRLYFYKIPGAEPELANRICMDWQPQYPKKKKKSLNLSPREAFKGLWVEFFFSCQKYRTSQ